MFIIKTNDAKHSTLLTTHSKHFVKVFNTSTLQCLSAGKLNQSEFFYKIFLNHILAKIHEAFPSYKIASILPGVTVLLLAFMAHGKYSQNVNVNHDVKPSYVSPSGLAL